MYIHNRKKLSALLLAIVMVLSVPFTNLSAATIQGGNSALDDSSNAIEGATASANGYSTYLSKYSDETYEYEKVSVDLNSCSSLNNVTVSADYENKSGNSLIFNEGSSIQCSINVPKSGLYTIYTDYFALESVSEYIMCALSIDGALPFEEAENIKLAIPYMDDEKVIHLDGKNDVRPTQVRAKTWARTALNDDSGYFSPYLQFYFTAGTHTLGFEVTSGSMAVNSFELICGDNSQKSYKDVLAQYKADGISAVNGKLENGITVVQAEDAVLKSDITLYPISDNSSPANQPYDVTAQKINSAGGSRWQNPGQWITWEVEVPASGLYEIGFRTKQNYVRDIDSIRSIYINDELQFAEATEIAFEYAGGFMVSVAGENDEPYLFYLKEGKNTIKLEVSLGTYSSLIRELNECIAQISNDNWSLLTLLSNNPDKYKDYNIEKYMPEVLESFAEQRDKLTQIIEDWTAMKGKQDSNIAQVSQIAFLLEEMCDDPSEIPSMFTDFRDRISTLSNTVINMKQMPLLVDYIFVAEQGAELPKANLNFFKSAFMAVKKFFVSFVIDYNNLSGDIAADGKKLVVWVGNGLTGGRDQAMVLNQLIMQEYTPKSGIAVDLQLVPTGTILTATISGKGPDVALQVNGGDVVNYAMRNAVVDLSKFDDFDQVVSRFSEAGMLQYHYTGGIYGLSETISFPMMFYRKDILEKLDIDINEINTWQDLMQVLPTIQRNNMQVSMQPVATSYYTFLFQNGGELYLEDGKYSALDSKVALNAFDKFLGLYTNYGLPYAYNFVTRFRNGEIPIGIEDYNTYNTLQISAPEISGKWAMRSIPGTEDEQGNITHAAAASTTGSIIMSASKYPDECWEFLKWWTDAKTQYKFGRELESVMGVGARYNTANLEALNLLPWSNSEKENLNEQIADLQGIPQVPGGYLTDRNVLFAISSVYNDSLDARKTLLSYVEEINQELTIRRKEFGLD